MDDYAWVWEDCGAPYAALDHTERWVVDCPDCGQLILAGSTRDQALRMANLYNTIRHGSKHEEAK